MPKYFFDIVQVDGVIVKDSVGLELPDVEAAKVEAKRCLAEMTREAVYEDLSEVRIKVTDADCQQVALRIAHFDEQD